MTFAVFIEVISILSAVVFIVSLVLREKQITVEYHYQDAVLYRGRNVQLVRGDTVYIPECPKLVIDSVTHYPAKLLVAAILKNKLT